MSHLVLVPAEGESGLPWGRLVLAPAGGRAGLPRDHLVFAVIRDGRRPPAL